MEFVESLEPYDQVECMIKLLLWQIDVYKSIAVVAVGVSSHVNFFD